MILNKYEQSYADMYKHNQFVWGNWWYGLASGLIIGIWMIWG